MVALPQSTLSPTVAAVNAHFAEYQDVRHARVLTARLLSLNCERQGWYGFRWAHAPKRFPAEIVRSNLGRREGMLELAELLASVPGLQIERVDPKTYTPLEVTAADGHYRQRIAGKVTGLLEAPKTTHLLYADQQPAKAYVQIVKHGLEVAKPDRIAALQVGMHLMGLTRAFYLVRNKDSDELHSERVELNAAHAMALLAKADRLRDSNEPPARVSDDPNWFECKFCPAFDQCHAGEFSPRNCRTCLHSTPVAGGGWRCARHEIDLSDIAQEVGCPHHLYLPGLVPGEQIDANPETETITYELLRNGRQWVDGAERGAA